MDEYFCTNCGATLNDQYGFDPSCGTWTCTSCGTLLVDDDVYDGDTYEGVAWFCDDCGALLNRQSGFSDSYGSWTCTECGHQNGITEDDIIDDYFSCPKCRATLNIQWGFNKYDDDHECSVCGAHLHHDYSSDLYEVVDDEDEDEDEDVDDDEDENEDGDVDDDEDEDEDEDENDGDSDDYGVNTNFHPSREEKLLPERELKKQRLKAFLFKRKKIQIDFSYNDLLRRNVDNVKASLFNKAFNNIKTVPIKDICKGSIYSVGEVEQVVIAASSYFNVGDLIPYDAEIIITYHTKKEITLPFSEKSLRKMNCISASDKLQELGFTEIYEHPIRDLVVGWVKKDGAVEKVTIGEVYPFKKNSVFAYDTKIVIEYHTFKKK